MTTNATISRPPRDAGFSLIEVMISTLIFSVISGVVIGGLLSMNNINIVVGNRTEMHSGVRNATELLQQEVGQAGRAVLPQEVELAANVAVGATTMILAASDPGALDPTDGMWVGMYLTVGIDENRETVEITTIDSATQVTLAEEFIYAHTAASPVSVSGGFAEGIIPTTRVNGSTGTVLKMLGDVQSNGSMVYVEYTCDTANNKLYRNVMAWDEDEKPVVPESMVLLDNLMPNPDGTDCFTYQEQPIAGATCVVGVAITLTVRTQEKDLNTGDYQTETKALLNVAPRNVFNVWQIASLGGLEFRVQPLPPSVITDLLPAVVVEED